jgi:hypothetical protein
MRIIDKVSHYLEKLELGYDLDTSILIDIGNTASPLDPDLGYILGE